MKFSLRFFSIRRQTAQWLLFILVLGASRSFAGAPVFINEIHYENAGRDTGEGVEIAGPAGTELEGWRVLFYNGNGGTVYGGISLSGTIPDQCGGFGTPAFFESGIQNGSGDGLALVDPAGEVVQYLSWEGTITATEGPAAGRVSADIGVFQDTGNPVGHSLQLAGDGSGPGEFQWNGPAPQSFGICNPDQTFTGSDFRLTEISVSTAGRDREFVEIAGPPGRSLADVHLLVLDRGGVIVEVLDFPGAVMPADGHFVAASPTAERAYDLTPDAVFPDNRFPNFTGTFLLVRGFTGGTGDDLDSDNDGGLDETPWERRLDGLALRSGLGERVYARPVFGPDGGFLPAGFFRCGEEWRPLDFRSPDGTPGLPNPCEPVSAGLRINEVDPDTPGSDAAEFVELRGEPGERLDGHVLVFFNGNGGLAYRAMDLDGFAVDEFGFFLVGNEGMIPAPPLLFPAGTLQNGPDAVALYRGDADDFPMGTPATAENLVDAVGYGEASPVPGLSILLSPGGRFLDESAADDREGHSLQRCPDGGALRETAAWANFPPTPGGENLCGGLGSMLTCAGDYPFTPIHHIQGDGSVSPLEGRQVVVQGIVVGDFQNNGAVDHGDLDGVFLQTAEGAADDRPETSEGLFVHTGDPGLPDVRAGERVRAIGTVVEYYGQTQLGAVTAMVACGPAALPPLTEVRLPAKSPAALERFEGMRVRFPQRLVISGTYNYGRFGEIVLGLPKPREDRLFKPTSVEIPGSPEAAARSDWNARARILLDDGRTESNPDPARHPEGGDFSADHFFRTGDVLENVVGVMDFAYGQYRIQPTGGAVYAAENPRPFAPPEAGGGLTVASFNVLNFFQTLDNAGRRCGPEQDKGCRGADSEAEFQRQRAKILGALAAIRADLFGLIELENTAGVKPAADLAAGINGLLGEEHYTALDTGIIGTDVIRVGMIYRPEKLEPEGNFAVLYGAVDPRFNDRKNRPVLAQTFRAVESGFTFTVAVAHLKSKGSGCGDGDDDPEQGNCNGTRTAAARAMADWLAGNPTGRGGDAVLVIGDLNAYAMEDPVTVLRAGADGRAGTADDYVDLIARFSSRSDGSAYSYVHDGAVGYLDHALASSSLAARVTGASEWPINADESDLFDYNTEYKSEAFIRFFEPTPYRSSDHDPVLVVLDF